MGARVLVRGVPHPETVAIGADGALYTGVGLTGYLTPGPVVRIGPDGATTTFADTGGRVMGIAGHPDDGFVCCDPASGAVIRLDRRGRETARVSESDGSPLRRPNGCVPDADGGVWFTDSGTAQAGEPTGSVCYVDPAGECRTVVAGLVFPNGIGLSADGRTLTISLTRDNTLLAFDVVEPGAVDSRRTLTTELADGPDGLTVGPDGTAYVAVTRSSRVVAVRPNGHVDVLAEAPDLLRMPSHAAYDGDRVLVPSLFGDTIVAVDLPSPQEPGEARR